MPLSDIDILAAERSLTSTQQRLFAGLQSTPMAVIVWDLNLHLTDWNLAAELLFGYSKDEVVGRDLTDIIVPEDQRDHVRKVILDLLEETGGYFSVNDNITKSGRRITCQWGNGTILENGKIIGGTSMAQEVTNDIEHRNRLEAATVRWQSLWNHVPDNIFELDLTGRIKDLNTVITGYTREQLVGEAIFEFIHGSYRAHIRSLLQRVINDGVTEQVEIETIGLLDITWWSVMIVPVVLKGRISNVLFICNDITQRKNAYQQIEELVQERTHKLVQETAVRKKIQAQYSVLTTSAPVGIYHADEKGAWTYLNEHCCNMSGLPFTEMLVDGWKNALHPDDMEYVIHGYNNAISSAGEFRCEYRLLKENGEIVWVLGLLEPLRAEEKDLLSFVGTMTDITSQRIAEQQTREHLHEVAHIVRLNTVGEMISGIAHEVNQPLAIITNYANGLLERISSLNLPQDFIKGIEHICIQAERAGEIIHRLKEFLSKGDLVREIVDVNKAICDTLILLDSSKLAVKPRITLELSESVLPVKADKIQLEQVVLNILNNAQEAMQDMDSKDAQIRVKTCLLNQKYIQIVICNNGPIIPQEVCRQLFAPFFTTKENGMGIGLSISKSIIEAHHGKIAVESSESIGGTCFTISLPIESSGKEDSL